MSLNLGVLRRRACRPRGYRASHGEHAARRRWCPLCDPQLAYATMRGHWVDELLGDRPWIDPVKGHDVEVTIDMQLQRRIENIFKHRRGAVVVIDARNGEFYPWRAFLDLTRTGFVMAPTTAPSPTIKTNRW